MVGISAITLFRSLDDPAADPGIRAEAARKLKPGGAVSRFTGKLVAQSTVKHTVAGTIMDAATVSFSLVGPPHVEPDREDQLALFHVQAFFYLCTYDENTQLGSLTPGLFLPLNGVPKSDWGNQIQLEFQRRVAGWSPRVIATSAQGYFQIMLRRQDPDPLWGWAVEWNKQFRICGFFGEQADVKAIVEGMPALPSQHVSRDENGSVIRHRRQIELAETDDLLFRT